MAWRGGLQRDLDRPGSRELLCRFNVKVSCMKLLVSAMALVGLLLSAGVRAQPASVSATCKDGTPFTGTSRSGACRGHGGVQEWGTANAGTTAPSAGPTTASGTATPPPATSTVAPGGGAGQVWVNTSSKVYHCVGDRWYGKTKHGEYMSEAQAKAAGNRADHNKACAS